MALRLTPETLVNITKNLGCEVEEQARFYKVANPNGNKKAIYIAKGKSTLTRVDFAGFTCQDTKIIHALSQEEAKKKGLGAVRGQILTRNLPEEVTDEEVLSAVAIGVHNLMVPEEGFKTLRAGRGTGSPPSGKKLETDETRGLRTMKRAMNRAKRDTKIPVLGEE